MVKCRRTVCTNEIDSLLGGGVHKHTGERYCGACARLINRACNEEVVVIPKFKTDAPNVQQIPRSDKEDPLDDGVTGPLDGPWGD